ncbi:unnamed protein product [Cylindrotheca closterium]|uniref:Peroxisomal membrane protein MPV17 n=1 Tax=Cylindrotheca closterium TaxID=2856 RepID=A0AAD2FJE9_9STRA|nr:unnamed protein product [Cylindrotheca closterium]
MRRGSSVSTMAVLRLRGGEADVEMSADDVIPVEETEAQKSSSTQSGVVSMPWFSAIASTCGSLGKYYSAQLEVRPILTKSWTAGLIFALSDYLAQRIEKPQEGGSFDTKRLIFTTMIGALYFAPAAHYWYEAIFHFLPGKGLVSTFQKALLGQAIFGPAFTCIFFASSLIQNNTFTIANWGAKIRSDLPGAWLAGSAFWPIVDIISYSLIPVSLIPLFVNICSLVWTIYLSIVANKGSAS